MRLKTPRVHRGLGAMGRLEQPRRLVIDLRVEGAMLHRRIRHRFRNLLELQNKVLLVEVKGLERLEGKKYIEKAD